jgi:broad specificity phosphatase PhoE
MTRSRRTPYLSILLFFLVFTDPAALYAQVTKETSTYIIVRHAEKVDDSRDPDLSAIGLERAERLAAMLASMKPDLAYTTPFKRTHQTVAPTAKAYGLTVEEYDPRNAAPLIEMLKALKGKTVLIAGHSNTAPGIVNALLGEERFKDLEDQQYDHLWIVQRFPSGEASVILIHY